MRRPSQNILSALLFLIPLCTFAESEESRLAINSGHIGPISCLEIHNATNSLVSGGEDGTLRIWDTKNNRLRYKIQVDSLPVRRVALHPTLPQAAVVVSDDLTVYRIKVIDWRENRELFSKNIEAPPIQISYSPTGSYIVYSRTEWQSLTFLESRSGYVLPYLKIGFGIVSTFQISNSEEKLVAYLSSGSIQYREIKTGRVVDEFGTLSDVTNGQLTSGNRYMIGQWQDSLIAIDLISGKDVASQRLPGLQSFFVENDSGTILCHVQTEEQGSVYKLFVFNNGKIISKFNPYSPPTGKLQTFLLSGSDAYTANDTGVIYKQPRYARNPSVFSENRLLPLSDVLPDSSLFLVSPEIIFTVYADFQNLNTGAAPISYRQKNPLAAPSSIDKLRDGMYLLRDLQAKNPRLRIFDPIEGDLGPPMAEEIFDMELGEVISIDTRDYSFLTLDTLGAVRIFDFTSQEIRDVYSAVGLRLAKFANGANIIVAGQKSQYLSSTMFLINTITGETVPFSDLRSITFQVVYDPETHTLYSLGIEGTAAEPVTVLRSHQGDILENSKKIYSRNGEDPDGRIAVDNGELFFSTRGENRILRQDRRLFAQVEKNNNIPATLSMTDRLLVALNRDSSVTMWDRRTGKKILDLFIFDNLSWVIVDSNGDVHGSGNSEKYITRYDVNAPDS